MNGLRRTNAGSFFERVVWRYGASLVERRARCEGPLHPERLLARDGRPTREPPCATRWSVRPPRQRGGRVAIATMKLSAGDVAHVKASEALGASYFFGKSSIDNFSARPAILHFGRPPPPWRVGLVVLCAPWSARRAAHAQKQREGQLAIFNLPSCNSFLGCLATRAGRPVPKDDGATATTTLATTQPGRARRPEALGASYFFDK